MRIPFILDSDASDSRLGAVLSQVQSGKERVIVYAAPSLSKAERNYSTLRSEQLALGWATENFETFLYGQHFLARTDHSALPWLENLKTSRSQVARWLERLSDFDFEVEHSPGQLHGNADGLSRLPFDEDASVKDTRDATLIQSVNMELVKGQSTCDSEPRSFKKTKQLFRTEILYNVNVKVMVLITNQLYFHLTFPPYPKNLIRT